MKEIITPRLRLRLMPEDFLEACLRDDRTEAERVLSLPLRDEWFEQKHLMKLRLQQCRDDVRYREWSLRAIALQARDEMIGYIGFHTLPGPPHLSNCAPGAVEMGYTISERHRRQGYATEAVIGMMRWAWLMHGVPRFVLSIAPMNAPSQQLATKLNFSKIGQKMDEIDGLEDIWLLEGERLHELVKQ